MVHQLEHLIKSGMFVDSPFSKTAGRRDDGTRYQMGWTKLVEAITQFRIFKNIHIGHTANAQQSFSASKNTVVQIKDAAPAGTLGGGVPRGKSQQPVVKIKAMAKASPGDAGIGH